MFVTALHRRIHHNEVSPVPYHWWKFDEGSGLVAADTMGNRNLTLATAGWVSGGCNATASYTASLIPSSGNYTLTAWVRGMSSSQGTRDFVNVLNGTSSSNIKLIIGNWANLNRSLNYVELAVTGNTLSDKSGATTTWSSYRPIAYIFDGNNIMTQFANGRQSTAVPSAPGTLVTGSSTTVFNSNLALPMSDMRWFDSALSEQEVADVFADH